MNYTGAGEVSEKSEEGVSCDGLALVSEESGNTPTRPAHQKSSHTLARQASIFLCQLDLTVMFEDLNLRS